MVIAIIISPVATEAPISFHQCSSSSRSSTLQETMKNPRPGFAYISDISSHGNSNSTLTSSRVSFYAGSVAIVKKCCKQSTSRDTRESETFCPKCTRCVPLNVAEFACVSKVTCSTHCCLSFRSCLISSADASTGTSTPACCASCKRKAHHARAHA